MSLVEKVCQVGDQAVASTCRQALIQAGLQRFSGDLFVYGEDRVTIRLIIDACIRDCEGYPARQSFLDIFFFFEQIIPVDIGWEAEDEITVRSRRLVGETADLVYFDQLANLAFQAAIFRVSPDNSGGFIFIQVTGEDKVLHRINGIIIFKIDCFIWFLDLLISIPEAVLCPYQFSIFQKICFI